MNVLSLTGPPEVYDMREVRIYRGFLPRSQPCATSTGPVRNISIIYAENTGGFHDNFTSDRYLSKAHQGTYFLGTGISVATPNDVAENPEDELLIYHVPER